MLLLALPAFAAAPSAPWAVQDAPFRAVVRADYPAPCPETGYTIEIPEFGHTLPNLADCILTDADGKLAPLHAVWRGEGQRVIFLAKEMKRRVNYYLYFGGKKTRRGETWQPMVSLLMETRRLPASAKLDNWSEMERTWRRAAEVDGAGFVPRIFHAANPFGDTVHFVTHYSGWLRTRGMKDVYLYTQSSDASFVVVNNRFELDWAGLHDGRANQKTVPGQLVRLAGDLTKIDYFHVKADPDHPPGMVLAGSGARSMRRSRRTRGCARNQRRSSAWRARAAGQCRWDGSSSVPTLDLKTSSSSRRAARCRTATRRVGR